ncbi:MAG TPA: hypothetical protein VFG63_00935 [Nocardioidaceae bacterium]|nr:hypothetical protein [Nocardioidaceae bacterium]
MRLLLVELNRFRSRRAIALMLLAAALVAAILATTTIYESRPLTDSDIAAAQAQADAEAQQPYVQRDLARCEKHPRRFMGPGATVEDCEPNIVPQVEWYLYRPTLSLAEERMDSGLAVLMIVSAVMIIVGTTFAGADWASGSISNQLIFEPRRLRVWLAKAGAVFLGTLVVSAVVLVAFWVALYVAAESRGIPTGAAVQSEIRWMVGRGVLMAGVAALGGFALTMLLRHTVGTLAVMFAYAVGGEALTAALPVAGAGRWSLANNVFAWLGDGHEYWDGTVTCSGGAFDCDQSVVLSLAGGVTYLGVVLLVVVVLSMFFFRRRDIA